MDFSRSKLPSLILACGLLLGGGAWALRETQPSGEASPTDAPRESAALPESASTPTPSFSPATAGQPARAGTAPATEQQRSILPAVDHHIADWRTFQPDRLVVRLSDQLTATFRIDEVQSENGRTVLTARLEPGTETAPSLNGSFMVSTANASDRWDALVVFPGLEYRVTVRRGQVSVEETPSLAMPCVSETMVTADSDVTPAPGDTRSPLSAGDNHTQASVDVLFLYNQRALSERNQDTQTIDADGSNYIAASNTVLANSRIDTFRWRYLGAVAAPAYSDNEDTEVDLRAMRDSGAIASFVRDSQRAYGADQVVLLVGGVKTDAVGRAWVGGPVAHSVVNYPFPTFNDGSRGTTTTSYTTTCHEMGHNFGCRHQRNDSSAEASDGDGRYNYGYTFPRGSGEVGTMMAVYVAPTPISRIPYFSSPDLTFEGTTLGVAANQPRAAFNARVMSENAVTMAGLETTISTPAITEQPRSQSASVGERVTLSVNATGGNLTYAWTKDGAALAVQSSSLSIASASTSSAGSYRVTVSNRLGTVTSDAAVLTINASSTVTPPAATSGGGGSGGGAWGPAFVLALLALGAERRRHA